jgi:RNA polymerase sigma-70 factor (ECF subfamily)
MSSGEVRVGWAGPGFADRAGRRGSDGVAGLWTSCLAAWRGPVTHPARWALHEASDPRERDAAWVAETLAGNRQAFGHLVEAYQKRVYALAYRYLGSQADAADLTQRSFLKAFENLAALESGSAFAAWLFRIAANLAKNEIRFRASKTFTDVDDLPLASQAVSHDVVSQRQESQALREALSRLPDKQRRCVLLRIDAELSFKEIGEAVGCSEVSARVNFHHGLKSLREALAPESSGPHTPSTP